MEAGCAEEHLCEEDSCVTQLLTICEARTIFLSDGDQRENDHTYWQISEGQAHYQSIGSRAELLVYDDG